MILKIDQQSPEWLDARLGKCTGSRVKDATSFLKNGKSSAARDRYMIDVVCERLTRRSIEHYVTPAMEWGIETERWARAAYEVVTDNEVDLVGIALHPTIENFAASPDGFVGNDGITEFKCPITANHVAWMLSDEIPEDYLPQLLAELSCSGRSWVDFVSFDPRLPRPYQMFIKRLHRDDAQVSEMNGKVIDFLKEADDLVVTLQSRFGNETPPPVKVPEVLDPNLYLTDADIPEAWR